MHPILFHLLEADPIILPEPPYSVPSANIFWGGFFIFLGMLALIPFVKLNNIAAKTIFIIASLSLGGIAIVMFVNPNADKRVTSVENSEAWYEESSRLLGWTVGENLLEEWDLLALVEAGTVTELYEDEPIEMFDPVEGVTMLKHRGIRLDGRVATYIVKNAADQSPLKAQKEAEKKIEQDRVDAILRGDPGLTKYFESLSDDEKKKFVDSVLAG